MGDGGAGGGVGGGCGGGAGSAGAADGAGIGATGAASVVPAGAGDAPWACTVVAAAITNSAAVIVEESVRIVGVSWLAPGRYPSARSRCPRRRDIATGSSPARRWRPPRSARR